jgi:putative membrane protein
VLAWLLVFAKGLLIGVANIIPGVSGGTFALLLGIYERLIGAVHAVGLRTLKRGVQLLSLRAVGRRAFAEEWRRVDGSFLAVLGVGAAAAILACSRLIKFLLAEHPAPTLAFFIGLILPSVIVPYRMMKRRGLKELLCGLIGAALVVALSFVRVGGGEQPGYLVALGCGALAISAMILPGVSGSFLMLVLGQFEHLNGAISSLSTWAGHGFALSAAPWAKIGFLAAFGVGAVLGLLAFARLLAWLLKRLHSETMAVLTGLIVGSLWTLWPFKDYVPGTKINACTNVWPSAFGAAEIVVLLALVAGFLAAVGVMFVGRHRGGSESGAGTADVIPPEVPESGD